VTPPADDPGKDALRAALDALRAAAPAAPAPAADPKAALLAALRAAAPPRTTAPDPAADPAASALAALRASAPAAAPPAAAPPAAAGEDPLAAIGDLLDTPVPAGSDPLAALDDLLGDPSPVDAPAAGRLAEIGALIDAPLPPGDDPLAALGSLAGMTAGPEADPLAGFDDLLSPAPAPAASDDPLAALDALLASPPGPAPAAGPPAAQDGRTAATAPAPAAARPAAGGPATLRARRPGAAQLDRPVFRIAILGDFSGRAARGLIEVGPRLAERRAIRLDADNAEAVIAGFATTLVLPIGEDGRGIAVPLSGIDDLHPDELVGRVELFDALRSLRQRLSSPSQAAGAVAEMKGWGVSFGLPATPSRRRSAGVAVPADRRLEDFAQLLAGAPDRAVRPSPIADLLARIVGPHVVPGIGAEAEALRRAVDAAMGDAMRLVLHHPEFQAVEAQWRTIDLLARRIETDERLELVLYDVSAEELATDLSAGGDLARTGFFGLLNGQLAVPGGVGFSAVCGLYSFEETPPHAELLRRIGMVAAHFHCPFFAAMSPGFLDVARRDRHPLVAAAWDGLRRDPVAAYLGLLAPRFLLRRPYGARSEPIDAFDFEEFSLAEGLSGMLWGNPAALMAILLARGWTEDGRRMSLGRFTTVEDMPYHVVTDPHGDQVALPCTERRVTIDGAETVVARGIMPVLAVRGRDVLRIGSFQSLAGTEIAGPWSGNTHVVAQAAAGKGPTLSMDIGSPARGGGGPGGSAPPPAPAAVPSDGTAGTDEADLDALLAGFGDAPAAPADPGSIDAELAALLEGL
jgi:hypothetical protein